MTSTSATTGFGLMGFTWRTDPIPDEQAFEAMQTAVRRGALDWSTADFYGPPSQPYANIELISRYFQRYPADADKVTLWVKTSFDTSTYKPNVSAEYTLNAAQKVQAILGSTKKLDYLGIGRRDKAVSPKDSLQPFVQLIEQGKIKGVFISEVNAQSIREFSAIHPISGVEVELSLFTPDILQNGVAQTAKELGIPLLTYSPLGRGFLTGAIKSFDELPEGDPRRRYERFQQEHLDQNLKLAQSFEAFSKSINATPAQVALAWVRAKSNSAQAGTLIPIPGATKAERVKENTTVVQLTDEQVAEIEALLPSSSISGGRASKAAEHLLDA